MKSKELKKKKGMENIRIGDSTSLNAKSFVNYSNLNSQTMLLSHDYENQNIQVDPLADKILRVQAGPLVDDNDEPVKPIIIVESKK